VAGRRHAFFNAHGGCDTSNQRFGIASHRLFVLHEETSNEAIATEKRRELLGRRLFLKSMGKWSAAAIAAAVGGGIWLALPPKANAGWINRRGGYGGGWINRFAGGGGGWINGGGGGGGWINRRGYGGGGARVNR